MKSACMIRHGLLLLGLYFCSVVPPGTLHAGTVKVATNVGNTYYFGEQNTFANVLLNCTGFKGTPGVDLTADGVSRRPGQGAWFSYHPKLTPGMWPDSTDDRATWYKFSYHCDVDASKNFPTFTGFTVAQAPASDGKGNWTGWLKFKESNLKDERIAVTVNYAKEDLDEQGLAQHPISQLKVLLPGSADDDFLSPIFKKRMTGFARLRFCDPFNMNGRPVGFGLDVPGTKNTYEREGKGNFRAVVNPPGNVQTETYFKGMDLNMSWGKGLGAGNHMTIWNGKKYDEAILGIGCLAGSIVEGGEGLGVSVGGADSGSDLFAAACRTRVAQKVVGAEGETVTLDGESGLQQPRLVSGPGFEPGMREPKSLVLPLHHPETRHSSLPAHRVS